MLSGNQRSFDRNDVKWAKQVKFIWLAFLSFFIGISVYTYLVSVNFIGLFGEMPGLDRLTNPKSELASELISQDGMVIGKYFRENRSPVQFEEISPKLIEALYATEDIRFDGHSGIDFKGTISILGYMLIGKKRGSSTISQQLAKNLFETRSEAYEGFLTGLPGVGKAIMKTKEWIIAIRLERSYTKREIITMYLNTVHFGSNAFGIKVAARTYFNILPKDLNAAQSALLVGLLKAPSLYSPIYNPQRSLKRRNTVIDQMEKYGFLTDIQKDSLIDEPIKLKYKVEGHNEGIATYFRTEARKELLAYCKENGYDLFSDGLKIHVTINSKAQEYAEQAIDKHMRYLQGRFDDFWRGKNPWADENGTEIKDFIANAAKRSTTYREYASVYEGNQDSIDAAMKRKVPMTVFSYNGAVDTLFSPLDSIAYYKRFLHAGLLSVEPQTGAVRAWVGGINYRFFKYDHVRQGRRQPGSSFKPFVYVAAIDKGYSPCAEMVDAPVTFTNNETGTSWTPKNADGKFTGAKLTLRKAIAQSINSVAAALMQKLGPETVVDYAKRLGIESPLDPVPALCLGSSDVSLYEMVGAYAAFVNKGTLIKPYFIEKILDKNGNVLTKFTPEKKEVLSEETAYLMVHMLRGATVERNGTALGLHRLGQTLQGNEVGGKTGTTSNYSDGWFMGITHNLVTGVWVGGDDRSIHFRTADLGQGARMAMPIWSYYMDAVYQDPKTGITKGRFQKPAQLSVQINCNLKDSSGADTSGIGNIILPGGNDPEKEF